MESRDVEMFPYAYYQHTHKYPCMGILNILDSIPRGCVYIHSILTVYVGKN